MDQRRTTSSTTPLHSPRVPSEMHENKLNGGSTRDALVAVARDTIDVATELVRDGVALARLETERAVREAMPRVVWGGVAIVCAATASVCAVIAIMIGLGTIIPSVAWRLVLLAAVLFVVAFFGVVRALHSERRATSLAAKEEPLSERAPVEAWRPQRTDRLSRTILPPPNA